jgi:hypothetical protein
MLHGFLKGKIVSMYDSFTTPSSKYKYVYVDLCNNDGYLTTTLYAADGYIHQIS